jgi:anti-sigma factor RsiW
MSEPDSNSLRDEAYEQLVAYLDGELDTETSQQVERRLAADGEYRRELQQLQRAWDLLDELPRAEVSEAFTQTTVEIVALSAAQDLSQAKGHTRRRERVLWFLAGASIVGAALASYLAFSAYFARPNTQLMRDLPVIENIELYQVADSVEFLRQLDEAGLFDEEVGDEH